MARALEKLIKLNDGHEIYQLGIGIDNINDENELKDIVLTAIGVGYHYFSSFNLYEREKLIKNVIKHIKIPRNKFYISTMFHSTEEISIIEIIISLLKSLGLEYIDLIIVDCKEKKWFSTYEHLLKCKELKYINSIGLSNAKISDLEKINDNFSSYPQLIRHKFQPGYWKCEVIEFCKKNNIAIHARGLLIKGEAVWLQPIIDIANKYNMTPTQVIISWAFSHGVIMTPKTNRIIKMRENTAINGLELSENEINIINNISL